MASVPASVRSFNEGSARQGCTVIVPFREEMAKRHLKEYDLRNTQSIEESIRHSDVVYNLIGRNYPTKYRLAQSSPASTNERKDTNGPFRNFTLEDVHVEGTERIVETAAKYNVDRYIHVSSYNAEPVSTSEFYATKGRGEEVARPVHVIDIGHALELMLYDDSTAAQTFELYGPKEYSTEEIAALVDREIFKQRRHINIPKKILKPLAGLLNSVTWWPYLSADEVEREFIDQKVDPAARTFEDLGIKPGNISDFTYHYLNIRILSAVNKMADLRLDGDDDPMVLSDHALAALAEFHSEQDAQYTSETAELLAGELLAGTSANMNIAFVSTPSVFVAAKNILAKRPLEKRPILHLLEFDERFRVFPEFVYYDYRRPFRLPVTLKGTADRVICDPPFLNEDCHTKGLFKKIREKMGDMS
ncbi:unnamed protein product [Parascedosporium putredinis]|uniref:Uncharacterized protein n=1 Tax=Parascedosporium putredinis TaxID=1442378 RepID=A0A9P1GZQ8_9PEZI|nr:unnamed protein product [Parascedosporium putredinis]CAI7992081.1 unnamed protein product [Parascedosporium putredinis]